MKRLFTCLLAITIIIGTVSTNTAVLAAEPTVSAPSVLLMEKQTGEILFESNAHQRLYPASVTKIMTLLLVMEAVQDGRLKLDDMIVGSANAASMGGSQVWLAEGESMSLDEMIKCVAVSSANDCAVALAEHLYGSEPAFVERMNKRVLELGMTNTTFSNCTGLDSGLGADEHMTTAYDIALMSRELLKHDLIRNYSSIWMDSIRNGDFGLSNTNKLVRFYNGATGLKTGYTARAGHCISATAEREGMELIAVVMNAASSSDRFDTAKNLLDFGFANYTLVDACPDETIGSVTVNLGVEEAIVPILAEEKLLLDKTLVSGLTREITVAGNVAAPVEKGQKLGELRVSSNGAEIATVPIVAAEAVDRMNWMQVAGKMLKILCMAESVS